MNYLNHFSILENPFTQQNDLRYVYLSESFREGEARLNLLLSSSGIFHLYGKYGTGKTILLDKFIKSLPANYHGVLINYTAVEAYCFLLQLSKYLGLPGRNNTTNLVLQIQEYVTNSSQHIILIIDEAQNLHLNALEALKLITSPAISNNKVSLILASLPELKIKISAIPALKQRITLYHHLCPLNIIETKEYIRNRLKIAGCPASILDESAINKIAEISEGIPREINKIANLAFISAASLNKKFIDNSIIETVLTELSIT